MLELKTNSVDQTISLGKKMGEGLRGGELIALIGELGTGKTHLIKGIAQGLAIDNAGDVTSPTFVLINEYEGRLTLYHIDAYRLESARQLEALGFDELCAGGGVVVVEWADRVWSLLGEYQPVTIRLSHQGPAERKIVLENLPDNLQALLSSR